MEQNTQQHYKRRLANSKRNLMETKRIVYLLGSTRLAVFLLTLTAVIIFWSKGTATITAIIAAGLIGFLSLLKVYNKHQNRKHYLRTSIRCDENELKALTRNDFSAFDGAADHLDSEHSFALDLDIFGNQSLFQSINRTCTNFGRNVLIDWFERPLRFADKIVGRQEAVRELCAKETFIHQFEVLGRINPGRSTDYMEIDQFVAGPYFIRNRKLWKTLSKVFPAVWLIAIITVVAGWLPLNVLIGVYLATFLISELQAKPVNQLQQVIGKKVDILRTYSDLIELVEKEPFESFRLKDLQTIFTDGKIPASTKFKRIAQLANELEQRGNLVVHLLLNPLLLWDIKKSIIIEEWKEKDGQNLMLWIKTLGRFDAFNSLGRLSFNHPNYVYPTLTDDYFVMQGKALGHPLMKEDDCVRNDIDVSRNPYFLIITGANMAGKSTYLRTIGVNYVLACMGAPVFADSLTLCPANLVTSLRTSDSLNNNESYFYAELKRLKMIIDRLYNGERLFIILDEILKGTNSIDKQKGSLALIEQLVKLDACGIIATHDLVLGTLEKEFPQHVKNYRFEADIDDDDLSFSYKLREGIAQNMNATFLMKKMGITV